MWPGMRVGHWVCRRRSPEPRCPEPLSMIQNARGGAVAFARHDIADQAIKRGDPIAGFINDRQFGATPHPKPLCSPKPRRAGIRFRTTERSGEGAANLVPGGLECSSSRQQTTHNRWVATEFRSRSIHIEALLFPISWRSISFGSTMRYLLSLLRKEE